MSRGKQRKLLDDKIRKTPIAEKRKDKNTVEKLLGRHLRRGQLIPGRLYRCIYEPKYKGNAIVLPMYDKTPLLLILKSYTHNGIQYILGFNLNHPRYHGYRLKAMFRTIIEDYMTKQFKGVDKKGNARYESFIDMDYSTIINKHVWAKFGIRLYIKQNFKNVKVVPLKYYDIVGTSKTSAYLSGKYIFQ